MARTCAFIGGAPSEPVAALSASSGLPTSIHGAAAAAMALASAAAHTTAATDARTAPRCPTFDLMPVTPTIAGRDTIPVGTRLPSICENIKSCFYITLARISKAFYKISCWTWKFPCIGPRMRAARRGDTPGRCRIRPWRQTSAAGMPGSGGEANGRRPRDGRFLWRSWSLDYSAATAVGPVPGPTAMPPWSGSTAASAVTGPRASRPALMRGRRPQPHSGVSPRWPPDSPWRRRSRSRPRSRWRPPRSTGRPSSRSPRHRPRSPD
ncbi:MAG: hypothetical protein NFCOHLIN_01995 [Gammaproteobacteria bacterium]|nr:hypothetical protein [Gammaproteobacteria bacterium]